MRSFAILWGALCLLALSGCAARSGVVLTYDDWHDTLQIGGRTYLVTPYTKLYGQNGRPIKAHQVPTVADPGIGVRHPGLARVEFHAEEDRGSPYLVWLRVRPR